MLSIPVSTSPDLGRLELQTRYHTKQETRLTLPTFDFRCQYELRVDRADFKVAFLRQHCYQILLSEIISDSERHNSTTN
jgi:hypothetical protein